MTTQNTMPRQPNLSATHNSSDQIGQARARRSSPRVRMLPRLLSLIRPHRGLLLIGMVALLLGSGMNLVVPYFIRLAANGEIGFSLTEDLAPIVFALIGLFALQAVFFCVRHYIFSILAYRVVTKLREDLFAAILKQDIAFFDSARVGELLSRLGADTAIVQRCVTGNISIALRYFVQILGGIVLMLFISVRLSLVTLAALPLIVIGSAIWGKRLRGYSKRMQEELAEANVVAEEAMGSIRTVRVFAGEAYEAERYVEKSRIALLTGEGRSKIAASFSSSMVFIMNSGAALVLYYGATLVQQGQLSLGDLTAFLLYGAIVGVSFSFITNIWDEFFQAAGAGDRIFEIIDREAGIASPDGAKHLSPTGQLEVEFHNVGFTYPSRKGAPVLEALSLRIPEGKTVALVGPSGAGKSTIASLIPRFYDVDYGHITFGGYRLDDLDLHELRSEISVVQQNPQVFSISIGENIAYGKIGATEAEVKAAADAAQISGFIDSLPEKYATLVGDRGIQLSGGERQRVAIARALLKNPRFLILDEATSSLDSENEALVQRALEELLRGRTTLVIAHRLSTVQNADWVYVMREGRVVQEGTHNSLVREDGLYRTLVEHQVLS